MTLVQLRYFVAAATNMSMTRAASEMHVSQSAVSTAIVQLERSLGVQLFVRQRSKGLTLTDAGEQLLRDSRSLLAQVDEMADAARGHHHEVRGTLRLACFLTIAPFVLPRLISRVQQEHPGLRIEIIEADADGTLDLVLNGSAEGAIAYAFGEVHDLTYNRLYSMAPHVILPVDHCLASQAQVNLVDLRDEDLILLDIPHSREYFLNVLEVAGIAPHIPYSSHSFETVRSLVARGHGYSILNHIPSPSQTYDGGDVRVLPIADIVPALDVCFVRATDVRPTARTRVVESLVRELFNESPW